MTHKFNVLTVTLTSDTTYLNICTEMGTDNHHLAEKQLGEKTQDNDLDKVESLDNGDDFQLLEKAGTKRNIKSRQAQMIAIGVSPTSLVVSRHSSFRRSIPG